jgi:hypothetical protein
MVPTTWWQRRKQRLRERKRAAAGFDLGFLRWLLCLSAILTPANLVDGVDCVRVAAGINNVVFGVLLCVYFGHILLRRLQCSLLEFSLLIVVLGNALGLLLTTPGVYYLGWTWITALLSVVTGWVLFGAVGGLTQARLLNATRPLSKVGFMLSGWLTTAAPALVIGGAALWLSRWGDAQISAFVSPNMSTWGIPLLLAGIVGAGLYFWLARKAGLAARAILNE